MDRTDIRKAALLLAKAESTESDAEAFSLALRSYSLIANALNAYDEEQGAAEGYPRRRERRQLRDRRALRRPPPDPVEGAGTAPEPPEAARYKRVSDEAPKPRNVDLPM